jgi:lysophospholipase L1-like esterase
VKISLAAVLAALTLVGTAFVAGANASAPSAGSLAALGDSITRGFDTCSLPYTDCPANSWSTGTNGAVNSWYLRLRAQSPSIAVNNDAKTGAKMADLAGQASTAVSQGADLVTVMMGANDVCTSTVGSMTLASTLGAQLSQALQTLTTGSATRQIYVTSIPNVYHLWEIFHLNLGANLVWGLGKICQSLLANPRSTSAADQARRAQVQAQTIADNGAIQAACAAFAQCHFDNGAAYNVVFTTADITTRDYFHPSVSGQAKAAAATWNAFFGP